MEEQTLHILNECSSGCKMAIHSMQQVLEYVENEKLEQVIMAAERKHKEIAARTAKALTCYGEKGKKPGAAAETFAWLTTEMKMLIRDDSSQIAKIMTNGCNMGIQSIMEVLNIVFSALNLLATVIIGVIQLTWTISRDVFGDKPRAKHYSHNKK